MSDQGNHVCPVCGAPVSVDAIACSYCKSIVKSDEEIRRIKAAEAAEERRQEALRRKAGITYEVEKSKWVTFFLCLFFGWFGAHKFYQGKIGMGIIYIFTVGLFMFGWFYDIVKSLFLPGPTYTIQRRLK